MYGHTKRDWIRNQDIQDKVRRSDFHGGQEKGDETKMV